MNLMADVILPAGRSAVELSLFLLLPVMVVMLTLMRLLEAWGCWRPGGARPDGGPAWSPCSGRSA